MADRTIVLATNGRHAVRGLTAVNGQEFKAYQEDDDNLTYVVDMSSYLDGDTISSVTRTPAGVTVSNSSNTTTRITQRLKGFGYVDFKIITTGGDTEEFRITIEPRAGSAFFLTNTASVPQNTAQLYNTVANVNAANIDSGIDWVRTAGYYATGDGGDALYKRVSAAPSHGAYITSNSGNAFWSIVTGDVVNLRALGAKGDGTTDDSTAIQAGINALNGAGGGQLFVPAGAYIVGTKITLKSLVSIKGENSGVSIFKAKASLNSNVFETNNYSSLTGQNKYLISAGLPYGITLSDIQIDGSKSSQSSGNGLVMYAKRVVLENIIIHSCKDIGWVSEGWNTVSTAVYPEQPENVYTYVDVQNCGSHGIQYRGPTDSVWHAVFSHDNGGWGVRFESDGSTYNGSCDVRFLHVYANTSGGVSVGVNTKCKFGMVETESNFGQGLVDASFGTTYDFIESYINCRTTGTHAVELSGSAIKVSKLWNGDTAGKSGVLSTGAFNSIEAGVLAASGTTGTGLTASGTFNHFALTIYGHNGVGGIGVQFGNGGTSLSLSTFNLKVYDCKTGYTNAATGIRNSGTVAVQALTGQVVAGTDFAANENINVQTFDTDTATSTVQHIAPVGTVSLPGVSFSSDRDTGVYRPSANKMSLVAGGVEAASVSVSGSTPQIGFLGTAPTSKVAITGSRGANAALANLLTELAAKGLITDSTTA